MIKLKIIIFSLFHREAFSVLVQNEKGVLPGSERFYSKLSNDTLRMFYYVTSCGHYFCEKGYRIDRSGIEQVILMYIEKGNLTVEYDGYHQVAKEGDIVLLDCIHYHYYSTPDYSEFYWIFFQGLNSFEFCDYLIEKNGPVFRTPNNSKIGVFCRHMLSKFSTNQPLIDSEHSRIIHSMLCYLMPNTPASSAEEDLSPARRAVQYIQEHLGEPLQLKDIAQYVDYSPAHLIRLFQKEFQCSPYEYLITMRMDHAKYLLKTTSMPIKSIALEVGYQTESGFTNAFSERIGIAPRQFRELPLG